MTKCVVTSQLLKKQGRRWLFLWTSLNRRWHSMKAWWMSFSSMTSSLRWEGRNDTTRLLWRSNLRRTRGLDRTKAWLTSLSSSTTMLSLDKATATLRSLTWCLLKEVTWGSGLVSLHLLREQPTKEVSTATSQSSRELTQFGQTGCPTSTRTSSKTLRTEKRTKSYHEIKTYGLSKEFYSSFYHSK